MAERLQRHNELWQQMSQGSGEFIKKLTFWEKASDKEQDQVI